jgi:hypothetical protein
MTRVEAERALRDNLPTAWEAVTYLKKGYSCSDFATLAKAYPFSKHYLVRLEIVETVGLVECEGAIAFLREVAGSRTYYLIRYYALRCLIDLGYSDWQSFTSRRKSSDFYGSLLAYEMFLSQKLSKQELRDLASSRTKAIGDHWYWLTQEFEIPR